MRKTFVLGKLAGSTSRILLLEGTPSITAPTRPALDASAAAPAKSNEPVTVH
jgi:hypothetical protein